VRHLIGKDIVKTHAVYWPTMLMAAELPLFRAIRVHGYWTRDGAKMSKSLGNVVDPLEMQARYGHDVFRYFLLREMAFGQDADFSESALVTRLNAELANGLGNLASRVLAMQRYCGRAPAAGAGRRRPALREAFAPQADLEAHVERFCFHRVEGAARARPREQVRHRHGAAARQGSGSGRVGAILHELCEAPRTTRRWWRPSRRRRSCSRSSACRRAI
jgi:methionyl-tRNA synthetase